MHHLADEFSEFFSKLLRLYELTSALVVANALTTLLSLGPVHPISLPVCADICEVAQANGRRDSCHGMTVARCAFRLWFIYYPEVRTTLEHRWNFVHL